MVPPNKLGDRSPTSRKNIAAKPPCQPRPNPRAGIDGPEEDCALSRVGGDKSMIITKNLSIPHPSK